MLIYLEKKHGPDKEWMHELDAHIKRQFELLLHKDNSLFPCRHCKAL